MPLISISREATLLSSEPAPITWLALPVFQLAATLGSEDMEKLDTGKIGSLNFLVISCLSTFFLKEKHANFSRFPVKSGKV